MIRVAELELHLFGGAGDVTRCGSGSDGSGSKLNDEHRWITKNVRNCKVFTVPIRIYDHIYHTKFRGLSSANTFVCFQKVGMLYM
jgi:hypothetical protein